MSGRFNLFGLIKMVNNNSFPDPTELVTKQRQEHEKEKLQAVLSKWRAEAKFKKKKVINKFKLDISPKVKRIAKQPIGRYLPRLKKYRKYLVPTKRIVIKIGKRR